MEITLSSKPNIIHREGNLAVFEVENLYPGYGITLGNALRRVLLSSLPGAAVARMKIMGTDHEFTTIPGVMEDVVSLVLNIKQLRFRLHGDEPQVATLSLKGERKAVAGDLKTPSQLEVVNKDALIATLSSKRSELAMELTVERGIGYLPVEMRKHEEKLPVGVIAIDAIFTPIRRVNFSVENMRIGERTDYNRLRIDIETDGSITPEQAFSDAAHILVEQFSKLAELSVSISIPQEPVPQETGPQDIAKQKIEDSQFSTRVKNALLTGGIKTVGGLTRKKLDDLKSLEGLGGKGIEEIEKVLQERGLGLKE